MTIKSSKEVFNIDTNAYKAGHLDVQTKELLGFSGFGWF